MTTRKEIEKTWGKCWDTHQAQREFEFISFASPYAMVKRKNDGVKGSLTFIHSPSFYFDFVPHTL